MTSLRIDVDDRSLQSALMRVSALLTDMRQTMDRVGLAIASRVRGTFDHQSDPWGRRWRPLALSTLRQRRKKGAGAQILRDTGRLQSSIEHRATSDAVEVFSTARYAAVQQFGHPRWRTGEGRAFFPARGSVVALPEEWEQEAVDLVLMDLDEAFR